MVEDFLSGQPVHFKNIRTAFVLPHMLSWLTNRERLSLKVRFQGSADLRDEALLQEARLSIDARR
jgi:hypothetical protein